MRAIARAFAAQPDVDMIGGRVEPAWEAEPPAWLPDAGYAPLALVDSGSEPFRIEPTEPRCLIGANVAIRRRALRRLHGFSARVQRVGDGIGSTEDHEFQSRLLEGGAAAAYDPRIVVRATVPRERLSKRYHRAWHKGHGRFYALMRDPLFERSRAGTVFGVPAHVYRSAMGEAWAWTSSVLRGRRSVAFAHELKLRFRPPLRSSGSSSARDPHASAADRHRRDPLLRPGPLPAGGGGERAGAVLRPDVVPLRRRRRIARRHGRRRWTAGRGPALQPAECRRVGGA